MPLPDTDHISRQAVDGTSPHVEAPVAVDSETLRLKVQVRHLHRTRRAINLSTFMFVGSSSGYRYAVSHRKASDVEGVD